MSKIMNTNAAAEFLWDIYNENELDFKKNEEYPVIKIDKDFQSCLFSLLNYFEEEKKKKEFQVNNNELSPCPFCKGKAVLFEKYDFFAVHCSNPNCKVHSTTKFCNTKEEAIIAWNDQAVIKQFEIEDCKGCKLTYKDSIGKTRCVLSNKKIDEKDLNCILRNSKK